MSSNAMTKQDREFQQEDDLRTLRRAEEIKKDNKRLSGAKTLARKEAQALKKIGGSGSRSKKKK